MPVGEIIAIGTELLLGEIQDTNTSYIARAFRDAGIDLYRTMIVGDNIDRIAQAIREALSRADIVITTGGLGPTVDDPTRLAVARATGVELEFEPELWEQSQVRFQRFHRHATENNRRQAYIPQGAAAIDNQVGTAPGFYFQEGEKIVISLPGVQREMEFLLQQKVLPLLIDRFALKGIIKSYVLHAAGVGESQVDEWISELETQTNPTVGLTCHPGRIDIRVTAKAATEDEADALIADTVAQIQQQVGLAIYGSNRETLEQVVRSRLDMHEWNLSVTECGLEGALSERFAASEQAAVHAHVLPPICQPEDLQRYALTNRAEDKSDVSLAAGYYPGPVQQDLYLYLITPTADRKSTRLNSSHQKSSYGVFCLKKRRRRRQEDLALRRGLEVRGEKGDCVTR